MVKQKRKDINHFIALNILAYHSSLHEKQKNLIKCQKMDKS